MADWLTATFGDQSAIAWHVQVPRLTLALLLGGGITAIYQMARRSATLTGSFPATLVLLCVLIAMVTQVIGDNIARAFSLVGALSIVRFRTVVRDTKDTAFVIFAVVVGMAVGAGQATVALCGMGMVTIAALLYRDSPLRRSPYERDFRLTARLTWSEELEGQLLEILNRAATDIEAAEVSTVRQGTALELTYRLRLNPHVQPTHLIAELGRLNGVHGIELRSDLVEA